MFLVIVACVIIFVLYLHFEPESSKPKSTQNYVSFNLQVLPTPLKKPIESTQEQTKYWQILKLVSSDNSIADRLIDHTQKTHPTKSRLWVLEKVLYDLERDRA